MLIRPGEERINSKGACVAVKDADFPSPFASGLEYSSPARGTWNIVHTGMLIPEIRQIFVCAENCLRGVILTAAEMGASERFSMVSIEEANVLDGSMEDLIIEGVSDILSKLPKKPPAVLLYTSCVHHFLGCDLEMCYRTLRERFPDVAFTDCYMNPIMRKSGLTPDELMRRQLYSLLEPQPIDKKAVNIIGNDFSIDKTSDLASFLQNNGYTLREVTSCRTYAEYQEMAKASINITTMPSAIAGGEALEKRLGQKHLYLPACFGADEIRSNMAKLADALGTGYDGGNAEVKCAEDALKKAKSVIGNAPISIDYTAVIRPAGLARLLLSHGFNVKSIFADSFNGKEKADFDWLRETAPELKIYATVQVKMRVLPRESSEKTLAIGQKAAYFAGTKNFVNIVENAGLWGFDGIAKLSQLMIDAFENEKDAEKLISQKGLGCKCCL